jgi:hypothetical protein
MALSLDPATRVITVPQADLTFVSGTLYTLDTNQFRKDVWDLLSSEPYIWMPVAFRHNTEVTVAGITYARTIEFINGYSVTFENTGSAYSIRLEGSNNNIFDIDAGILNPTPLTTVIPTNSAGLITSGDSRLVKQILANYSEISVAGDGVRTVTVKDSDDNTGATVGTWTITADGLIRERTS